MFNSFQEAVDSTFNKLKQQGGFSFSPQRNLCVYMDHNSRCCAVGVHIKNEGIDMKYEDDIFGLINNEFNGTIPDSLQIKGESDKITLNFWKNMQWIHDSFAIKHTSVVILANIDETEKKYAVDIHRHLDHTIFKSLL